MEQFKLSADIREVNRYDFVIFANNEDEAKTKLKTYLKSNIPSPFCGDIDTGVTCIDRESSVLSEKILKIK